MSDRDIDFEARVRLRRSASPETVIAEMVADGLDETASRRAMSRVLDARKQRKQNGLWVLAGGGFMALAGFAIWGVIGWVLIVVGLTMVGKGGSDAFSF